MGALVCVGLAALACDRAGQQPVPTSSAPPVVASVSGSAPSTASAPVVVSGATPCGAMGCLQFDSPEEAFRHVLKSNPSVLAIGEAHAQKGSESVPSAAKRFTDTFLPFLKGKASDLVLELMAPNPSCKQKTKAVAKKHETVTKQHAATNQSEYVQMGERARALGIVPDLLRPSCEDLSAIDGAGDTAIAVTLETIARLTTSHVGKLLGPKGRKPEEANKMIVTYGGVLHNDLQPDSVRAAWSFGPALSKSVNGRYIALDLFVPEFIEDTDVWRKLAWFDHYDKLKHGEKATLFQLDDQSFVLIFPLQED